MGKFCKKSIYHVIAFVFLTFSCNSIDEKADLLKCSKPWNERTEQEKLIGVWCSDEYSPSVGRRSVTQNMSFYTKIYFYSDKSIKITQVSKSYFQSEDLIEAGNNVDVQNGVLTYKSQKYGTKSHMVSVSVNKLLINGFVVLADNPYFSKCY
jgi:hypothetical protein